MANLFGISAIASRVFAVCYLLQCVLAVELAGVVVVFGLGLPAG